jgi:hypothetical protein
MRGGLEPPSGKRSSACATDAKRELQSAQFAAIVDARVSSQANGGAHRSSSADVVMGLLASLR